MRFFLCALMVLSVQNLFSKQYPNSIYEKARRAGVPMKTFDRAIDELHYSTFETYSRKDVLTIFDLSKPSTQKRLYVIDLQNGDVDKYYVSHGSGNGLKSRRAKKFSGYNRYGANMTPLGPLKTYRRSFSGDNKTSDSEDYGTVREPGVGTFRGLNILDLDPAGPNNQDIGRMAFHSKLYTTDWFRRKNGRMGNSNGCLALRPQDINKVIKRTVGGSLVYVAVGNDPVEWY